MPRRLDVDVLVRVALANLGAASFVFVYFGVLMNTSWELDDWVSFILFVAYVSGASLVWAIHGRRMLSPPGGWTAQREAPLRLPYRFARVTFTLWAGAAVLFASLNLAVANPANEVARIGFGVLLGGLTASFVVFLLVERRLRPVFALALAGSAPTRPSSLRVTTRLVLAWALGSGVPLIGIASWPFGRDDGPGVGQLVPIITLAAAGLGAGGLLVWGSARAVASPLERLRGAAARVRDGDLTAHVAVNDGGEIGLLQAGFNRMAEGLRERERVRELFGRYVGDEVAQHALEQGSRLGGETREVSVLFVDIVASTRLAQERDPTEVVALLNRFFATVVRVVGRAGGWVNKFEGDGALCVFGAPVDQPDHATRALRAARELRLALTRLGDVGAGIAVSSGPAVAGHVGAEERYEYTVLGDAVNEAARLTDLAKGRGVHALASEAAVLAAQSREAACWRPAGAFELRGRAGTTTAYEPID